MADLDSLGVLTGQTPLSEMSDDELREHLRQIRQLRITPRTNTGVSKARTSQAKSRTTQSPMDALLRSMSPEALAEIAKALATQTEENKDGSE